jgi:hypothetical protein
MSPEAIAEINALEDRWLDERALREHGDGQRFVAAERARALAFAALQAEQLLRTLQIEDERLGELVTSVNRAFFAWQRREESRGSDIEAAMLLTESIADAVKVCGNDNVAGACGWAFAAFRQRAPAHWRRLGGDEADDVFSDAIKAWRGRKGRRPAGEPGQWDEIAKLAKKIGPTFTADALKDEWSKRQRHRRETSSER